MFIKKYIGDEYLNQNIAQKIKNKQTFTNINMAEEHIFKASFCFSALKLLFLN